MTVRAVIDIGSHSVLLLVAEGRPPRVLAEQYNITALGSGLGQAGKITPEAAGRTRRVIDSCLAACRELGAAQVTLVGTGTDPNRTWLATLTLDDSWTSEYKNHGQYVKEAEDKKAAAHSMVGMPIQSQKKNK